MRQSSGNHWDKRKRRERSSLRGTLLLMAALVGTACTGTIDDAGTGKAGAQPFGAGSSATAGENAGSSGGQAGSHGGGKAGSDGSSALDCDNTSADPGPAPLRLLSRTQYTNTVHDLVGDVPGLDDVLGANEEASAFGLVAADITQVQIETFGSAAELIATTVTQDQKRLATVAPCADMSKSADCARAVIQKFGARAYRSPISDAADIDRHVQLFNAGATTSYAHGIEMLMRGMLQAPRFLYRVEIGTTEQVSDNAIKLSDYELASRLSYLLWDTMPDDTLLAAVNDGSLTTQAGRSAQLKRMLDDSRGGSLVRRFLERWVHLDSLDSLVKDKMLYPEWQTPAFRAEVHDQASGFFDYVLGTQAGKLSALLTSTTVVANQDIADYYYTSNKATGAAFTPLAQADSNLSGLLTLPAILALNAKPDESWPIYRGKFVRELLLCEQLPSPPANIPKPPEVMAGVSTRERLAEHETNPACSACHQLIDPIGFGFEHFDAVGRYRTDDGGKKVDSSGKLVMTQDIDGTFDGVVQLGDKLAGSAEVEACMTKQWFRFAVGRFEQDFDACAMQRLLKSFQDAGQNLNTLPEAIIASDAFLYRRPLAASDAKVSP